MEKTRSGKKTEDGWLPPNPEKSKPDAETSSA